MKKKSANTVTHLSCEWTEDDNGMVEETRYFLKEYQLSNRCKDENGMQNSVTCELWLESLEGRFIDKEKEEWTAEDNVMYDRCLMALANWRDSVERHLPHSRDFSHE
jgi:hypothetical protein